MIARRGAGGLPRPPRPGMGAWYDGGAHIGRISERFMFRKNPALAKAAEALPPLDWKDRSVVFAGMAAVLAVAWGYLLFMSWQMQNMHAGGWEMWMPPAAGARAWTLYDLTALFSMWAVMMVAMMLPSVLPATAIYAALGKRRHPGGSFRRETWLFVFGYLLVWVAFSALAALVQWPLHVANVLNRMMEGGGLLFGGLVLLVAGVYQWTPLKTACLDYCRSPLGFLLSCWKDGAAGAVGMGARNGLFCLGCCWALMLVMFAVGVMNVLWMALIAVFVLVEKVVPPGTAVRVGAGVALAAWGAYWLLRYFSG